LKAARAAYGRELSLVDTDRKADTVSTMDEGKRQKRQRRSFTDEFKAGAVRLVLDEG